MHYVQNLVYKLKYPLLRGYLSFVVEKQIITISARLSLVWVDVFIARMTRSYINELRVTTMAIDFTLLTISLKG